MIVFSEEQGTSGAMAHHGSCSLRAKVQGCVDHGRLHEQFAHLVAGILKCRKMDVFRRCHLLLLVRPALRLLTSNSAAWSCYR